MHREYSPEHLRPGRMTPDAASVGESDGLKALVGWMLVIGSLLAAQLVLDQAGASAIVRRWPITPVRLAAILGAGRLVYLALEAILRRSLGADLALAIAAVAAIVVGEDFVAAEVVLIALLGEALEAWTARQAIRAIGRAFDQSPRMARVRRDGVWADVPSDQVGPGEVVQVGAGEKIPVDGPVISGRTAVDESALTGEPMPVDRGPGDLVCAGTMNQFGQIEVRADRVGRETTLGQVHELVAEAQARKGSWQRTADRWVSWFLPVVLGTAAVTFAVGWWLGWPDAWSRAVAILVVACPCALILATPAAIMASYAWMARHGVIVKGGAAIERLAACDTVAFDKTGTLTAGRPTLTAVWPLGGRSEEELLRLAASAEQGSRHPIARAVMDAAASRGLELLDVEECMARPGAGIVATWKDGEKVIVGNPGLMEHEAIDLGQTARALVGEVDESGATSLIVASGREVAGVLGVSDEVRSEAPSVVQELKRLGIRDLVILTGDRARPAEAVARRVGLTSVESEQPPAAKAKWVRERQEAGAGVLFVGDGINDAPALATADVGIALGLRGADLAAEAGDVVLLGEPLRHLPDLLRLSRATVRVLRQNILVFAFGLNAAAMAMAASGRLTPVAAAILHQAGSLLVLLNSMRLLGFGGWRTSPVARWVHDAEHALESWDSRFDLGPVLERTPHLARKAAVALGLLAILTYGGSGLTAIGPDEVGLVRRLGRYEATIGPGLHLRWPRLLENVARLKRGRVETVTLGGPPVEAADDPTGWGPGDEPSAPGGPALYMTGDGQLVELAANVQYRLRSEEDELRRAAFSVDGTAAAVGLLAESVVRTELSRRRMETLLGPDRARLTQEVGDTIRNRLEASGLGVQLVAFGLDEIHPPRPILDAYREVTRAEKEAEASEHRAESYAAEQQATARAEAFELVSQAEAARTASRARSSAQADVFAAWQSARAADRSMTDSQLLLETYAEGLSDRDKVLVDPSLPGRRRHLILRHGSETRSLPPDLE